MLDLRLSVSSAAIVCALAYAAADAAPAAAQQVIVIPAGTTSTGARTVSGTDSITVETGATLTSSSNPTINWNNASTGLVITNSGTISSTASGARAINASGSSNQRSVTLTNNAGAVITSEDDAFRINVNPTAGSTILVNNYGSIRTTNGGQALDFDSIANTGVSVTINNFTGAELRSFGQDGIRPGQGATVYNAGLIFSDGAPNSNYDGIDWQGRSGTVTNDTTGVISGLRHGITSDVAVDVTNRGTILGRNGSGIGSDGTGTVTNYGTITGQWDGVATNGDGDGVDVDFIATVNNYGTIQGLTASGVDSGGRPNSAQGVAIGGGTVNNYAGATILGGAQGVLVNHDTNPGGVADGATTILNNGTIRGNSAEGVLLVGNFNDTVTTSGLIAGGNGTALDLGDGDDTLNVTTGATFTGLLRGGAGTDTINLSGSGSGTLGETADFEALNVNAGAWALDGSHTYNNGVKLAANTSLTLNTGSELNMIGAGTAGYGAVTLTGSGTKIVVNSVIRGGSSGPGVGLGGISAQVTDGSGTRAYAADITVAKDAYVYGNLYYTPGALLSGGGSVVNVNGTIAGTGVGSNGITYTDLLPGTLTINIGQTGRVQSSISGVAIDGRSTTLVPVDLTVAGTLYTGSFGPSVVLGGAADRVTITNTAAITSTIDAGAGIDTLRLQNAGSTAVAFPDVQSFENLEVMSGVWTTATYRDFASVSIASGAELRGAGNAPPIRTSATSFMLDNAGTLSGNSEALTVFPGLGTSSATIINRAGATIKSSFSAVDVRFPVDGASTVRIDNSGTIQSTSSTGVIISGSRASGVVINNNAGGTISGTNGLVVARYEGGPAGTTTLVNNGTISGSVAEGVKFVGTTADTVTTSGAIIGGNGIALDLGAGDDTLNMITGATFTGTVAGGDGNDTVNLMGTGNGSFGTATGFETLKVLSGNWTLTAANSYANGLTIASGSSLTGSAATLTGRITDAGTLTINQPTDATFTGTLTGSGQLVKSGSGALTMGSQSFTGATSVTAGKFIVAGNFPSAVTVGNGATIGGTGTVAALLISAGGTVSPGNSPGTLTVTGNFVQAAGSTYLAETTAAGASDHIIVGGTATIGSGAILNVTRDGGSYTVGRAYQLLTANGGVSGSYTLAQTASGGTEFRYLQSANAISVVVARTGASLTGLARTPNEAAVAPAFAALGVGNGAYGALTTSPDDAIVRQGLDQLAGEVHASLRVTMLKDAQTAENAVRDRIGQQDRGLALWVQGVGVSGTDDGAPGVSRFDRRGWGTIGGIDTALGARGRAGLAVGYTHTTGNVDAFTGTAKISGVHALAYAGGSVGAVSLSGGIGYTWTRNKVNRVVAFNGYGVSLTSRYDGNVLHGFAEAGVPLSLGRGTVEPFAGIEGYHVKTEGFSEAGGDAALSGRSKSDDYAIGTLGLKLATPIVDRLMARGRLGWQHVLGDLTPTTALSFGSGAAFTVQGAPLSRDGAAAAIDVAWKPSDRVTLTGGYSGVIGGNSVDHRFRATLSIGL